MDLNPEFRTLQDVDLSSVLSEINTPAAQQAYALISDFLSKMPNEREFEIYDLAKQSKNIIPEIVDILFRLRERGDFELYYYTLNERGEKEGEKILIKQNSDTIKNLTKGRYSPVLVVRGIKNPNKNKMLVGAILCVSALLFLTIYLFH